MATSNVVNGSPEHFQQVVTAHMVSEWGNCRCGVRVGVGVAAYRAHIESVWRPHALPEEAQHFSSTGERHTFAETDAARNERINREFEEFYGRHDIPDEDIVS